MIGIELKTKVAPYVKAATQLKLLTLPAGPITLRLLPPINITKEQADEIVNRLVEVFEYVQNSTN
jgi:acetylornithine/succinyldiaminopimelate/putrescine aminotransferase